MKNTYILISVCALITTAPSIDVNAMNKDVYINKTQLKGFKKTEIDIASTNIIDLEKKLEKKYPGFCRQFQTGYFQSIAEMMEDKRFLHLQELNHFHPRSEEAKLLRFELKEIFGPGTLKYHIPINMTKDYTAEINIIKSLEYNVYFKLLRKYEWQIVVSEDYNPYEGVNYIVNMTYNSHKEYI